MPDATNLLSQIKHIVVLMLENRSFDHLVGSLEMDNSHVAGLHGNEFNFSNPNDPTASRFPVRKATSFTMSFDPGHEFEDVQIQLYGPNKTPPPPADPPSDPPLMNGFISSALAAATAAKVPEDAARVMEYFEAGQIPVMATLAQEFALFNFWHSSLPGPTWPNRFFVHAATSGGLTDSPGDEQIVAGFSFPNGTIFQLLNAGGKDWRIYHGGIPQTAGIDHLRPEYIDPFTKHFREMKFFLDDVRAGSLPEYVFIEPKYDTGHNYLSGNSMHPLNDLRKGELLIKEVYEALRDSSLWAESILIITFDEHGGFYDHVPPIAAIPTGDDSRYANPQHPFGFDRLGVRVPAVLASAFTERGTVIGSDPKDPRMVFDHTSILATIEKRFGLSPLTRRDAKANTLEVALNRTAPRNSDAEALTTLPNPLRDPLWKRFINLFRKKPPSAADDAALSRNQQSFLALALAVDLNVSGKNQHQALRERHRRILRQKEAAEYIQEVEQKIHSRRASSNPHRPPKGPG